MSNALQCSTSGRHRPIMLPVVRNHSSVHFQIRKHNTYVSTWTALDALIPSSEKVHPQES